MYITEMLIEHYDDVLQMMQNTPGITIREADSKAAIERYLLRNPGLSLVAIDNDKVVGCVMCGHDGRRGYLHHLLVIPEYQNQGIATSLIERCVSNLAGIGIFKIHVDVLLANDLAQLFWLHQGWEKRTDICRYSLNNSSNQNI